MYGGGPQPVERPEGRPVAGDFGLRACPRRRGRLLVPDVDDLPDPDVGRDEVRPVPGEKGTDDGPPRVPHDDGGAPEPISEVPGYNGRV